MTAKEKAKEIRKTLKEMGIRASVRCERGGYSDAIRIIVNDMSVDLDQVEKVAKAYEDYELDERTGEILEGGNTYVFISYSYDLIKEAEEKMLPKAKEVLKACGDLPSHEGKVFGRLSVFPADGITFRDGKPYKRFADPEELAAVMVASGCF